MQSNLIRPSQFDSAGHGVMVDSSERGLCSGEGIETAGYEGSEVRQPTVPIRSYSPPKPTSRSIIHCTCTTVLGATIVSMAKDTVSTIDLLIPSRVERSLGTWITVSIARRRWKSTTTM